MFEAIIAQRLSEDRERIAAVYRGEELPEAPLVRCQAAPLEAFRMPEYFRGRPEAKVAFIGPHALLVPEEAPPLYGASAEAYVTYHRSEIPNRIPFNHYNAIAGEGGWFAMELPPYRADKDLVIATLKAKGTGAEVARRSLDLIWALVNASGAQTLVVTGGDAMRWVWPDLGLPGKPPSATQGHAKEWGRLALPGAPERTVKVVTSFHWGKEVPLFVRKVPGLAECTPREAISRAREMVAAVVGA